VQCLRRRASPPYLVFGVELHQRKMLFRVQLELARAILQFREGLGTRTRIQRVMVLEHISMADEAALQKACQEHGLPPIGPADLGAKLGSMLSALLDSIGERAEACTPYFGPFVPRKVTMLLSASPTIHPFVAIPPQDEDAPMPPPSDSPPPPPPVPAAQSPAMMSQSSIPASPALEQPRGGQRGRGSPRGGQRGRGGAEQQE
jgi:hypothetical protein